ncbi:single-stranded DNA-binding protein [Vibrio parahaemolyticus]|uniref:single-stranded DNA-binding protein n=1 Tax=Vibrio parahaemolyticus TaxID=670 RepID=UPI000A1F0594|nr:single-stranded DNA-binding protein [Vibrio parahaemolyticus]
MKNQVTLIGYVGAEPETRAYPSGDLVTSISLATSEKWRDRQSNELKEHTEWHRVVFRDRGGFKLGLRAKDLIQKGAKLFVQGPQRTRSWEKDGIKHRLTEVDADEFLLLDSVNKASEPSLVDDAGSQTNWAQTYPEPDF